MDVKLISWLKNFKIIKLCPGNVHGQMWACHESEVRRIEILHNVPSNIKEMIPLEVFLSGIKLLVDFGMKFKDRKMCLHTKSLVTDQLDWNQS